MAAQLAPASLQGSSRMARVAFAPAQLQQRGRRALVVSNAAKVTGKIKLALQAGKVGRKLQRPVQMDLLHTQPLPCMQANPSPPVGPALGSKVSGWGDGRAAMQPQLLWPED
jgi:hypothetical protein